MTPYKNFSNETSTNTRWYSKLNWQFLTIIGLITLIAFINFYSITHTPSSPMVSVFWKQVLWITFGFLIFFILSAIDYQFFCRFSYFFYGVNILALTAVLFFGQSFHGAQRWFDFGWFSYQPSETMKAALICVLASIFSKKSTQYVYGFRQMIGAVVAIVLPMVLIVYQPDLGTALLIGIQGGTVALFLRMNRRLWITFTALFIIVIPALWTFVLKDYQKNRVLMFMSADKDPYGAGYNTIQSKIAIGSGQIFGKGFQHGTQAQLEFLPERHTDFVFSVLSEEHGFAGSLFTIAVFLILILKIFQIASESRDKVGTYLCLGALSIIFWHTIINISMAIGLLPVVGVPLPILSYGGSNTITTFIILGLVSSVSIRRYLYS